MGKIGDADQDGVITNETRIASLSRSAIARIAGAADPSLIQYEQRQGVARGELGEAFRRELLARMVVDQGLENDDDAALVSAAAARGMIIVREHRKRIDRLNGIFDRTSEALEKVANGEKVDERHLGRLSLVEALDKLAGTLGKLIAIERVSYGIDAQTGSTREDIQREKERREALVGVWMRSDD